MQGYKGYRVSSQRFSQKPMNVEFVLVVDMRRKSEVTADEVRETIQSHEEQVLDAHPECTTSAIAGGPFVRRGNRGRTHGL